jgi:hypothetical protein
MSDHPGMKNFGQQLAPGSPGPLEQRSATRIEPPSSGHWKSTEELKKGNDERDTPAMRLVREKRERRVKTRAALRDLGRRLELDGPAAFDRPGARLLTGILSTILDELEAR